MTENRPRIVATAPIGATAIDILEQVARVEIAPAPDEQTMMGLLDQTVGLIGRGEGRITARMINGCPSLRVIGRPGAGYDSVDLAAATARNIPLVYAPVSGFAVAEGALALLLAIVKKIVWCDEAVKNKQWQKRYEDLSGDLAEHTLGIVGLGRIGAHLARLCQPFGMTILGYDPYLTAAKAGVPWVEDVGLDELLARSDFVSLHMPLTDQTRGLINRERLARMKRGAVLINTARGGVIQSLDVVEAALASGQLSAVGLDVFPQEPPDASHPIFRNPRLLSAPHMLGTSELAMERIYRSMANDMVAVLNHRRPKYCVNPETLSGFV
jgi:phosphoglycerate dehydrogenase-like enzyme